MFDISYIMILFLCCADHKTNLLDLPESPLDKMYNFPKVLSKYSCIEIYLFNLCWVDLNDE